jgi:N-acetylglucosamine kinase-like BadF-type ATPase
MVYLIADSGSTKTDWCLLQKNKKPIHYTTAGINPYLEDSQSILAMLEREIPTETLKSVPDKLIYYGAGASSTAKQQQMKSILTSHFSISEIEVNGDMLAAARALCGNDKGIVSILGTGSGSCYYNGEIIKDQQPSLGYIAGDEGSGNHMGKRVLQYYTYGTFDDQLKMDFEMRFGADIKAIVHKLYHDPYPNRYLASFVVLLKENRGHYMVENIIEDCLNDFFQRSILKYRESWKLPLYFSGSVAHIFSDIIISLCHQFELQPGTIMKSPVEGLIDFHKKQL